MNRYRVYIFLLCFFGISLVWLILSGQYYFSDGLLLFFGLLVEVVVTICLVMSNIENLEIRLNDNKIIIGNCFGKVSVSLSDAVLSGIELKIWMRRFVVHLNEEKLPIWYTRENIAALRLIFAYHKRVDLDGELTKLIKGDYLNFQKRKFL